MTTALLCARKAIATMRHPAKPRSPTICISIMGRENAGAHRRPIVILLSKLDARTNDDFAASADRCLDIRRERIAGARTAARQRYVVRPLEVIFIGQIAADERKLHSP